MDCVLQVEGFNERRQVVGICVHFVSIPRLARAAMAAAIMGNASISPGGQKEHLVLKGIRGERPAMTENDRLSLSPVLVVNLRAVFGRDGRSER